MTEKKAATKVNSGSSRKPAAPKDVSPTGGNAVKPDMGRDESGDHNDVDKKKTNAGRLKSGAGTADRNKELSKGGRAGTGSRPGSKSGGGRS